MKKQSVDVLNEADDFSRKLNWQLFCAEIAHIWEGGEGEWRPGTPIEKHPNLKGYGRGNCVRFLVDEIDDLEPYRQQQPRCRTCEVSWEGSEPCFICGEIETKRSFYGQSPYTWGFRSHPDDPAGYRDNDIYGREVALEQLIYNAVAQSLSYDVGVDHAQIYVSTSGPMVHMTFDWEYVQGDVEAPMQGYRSMLHVIDETWDVEPYVPPIELARRYFDAELDPVIELPANWRELRSDRWAPPEFQMSEISVVQQAIDNTLHIRFDASLLEPRWERVRRRRRDDYSY